MKIYELTEKYPKKEDSCLTAQLRRAAISVPSNIAEGLTRKSSKDKIHFLNIAQSSLSEIETQLEIAIRLGYLDETMCESVQMNLAETQMMLGGLSWSIQ